MAKSKDEIYEGVVGGAPPIPLAINDFAKSNGLPRAAFETMPGGPSLTRQEFAEECDINNIMQRYDAYISDPMRSVREPVYYDFTAMPDSLMGAMEVLHRGEEAFFRLPAVVRKEFDNDPARFVDYAADPSNVKQMREWGLAAPEKLPDVPMAVRVVASGPNDPALAAASEAAQAAKKADAKEGS